MRPQLHPARSRAVVLFALVLLALPARAEIDAHGPAHGAKGNRRVPVWPAWIQVYQAVVTPTTALITGRVYRGQPPAPQKERASDKARLLENVRLFKADPLPDVGLRCQVAGREAVVKSDEHGYFHLELPAEGLPRGPGPEPPSAPARAGAASLPVRVELADPGHSAAPALATATIIPPGPGLAVISDVDDTLADTRVREGARMLVRSLLTSGYEMTPIPGAAETMKRLCGQGREGRPIFYVSGSPWRFYDRLLLFLDRGGFPAGTLLLKRFSSEPLRDQMAYKYPHLLKIVDALPERRFVLFGDSGESDPEVYARLRAARPGRVAATLIHRVTPEEKTAPRFSGHFVFDGYPEARQHLLQQGLLPPAAR